MEFKDKEGKIQTVFSWPRTRTNFMLLRNRQQISKFLERRRLCLELRSSGLLLLLAAS
jgi:hypothetical protein